MEAKTIRVPIQATYSRGTKDAPPKRISTQYADVDPDIIAQLLLRGFRAYQEDQPVATEAGGPQC